MRLNLRQRLLLAQKRSKAHAHALCRVFEKCAGFPLAGAVMAPIGPGVFVWIFAPEHCPIPSRDKTLPLALRVGRDPFRSSVLCH